MKDKQPFHELVAEKLIEQLKAGTAPWQRPWKPGEPGALLPMNPTTGKRYKGINAIHLMSQGCADQRWMTYKQAERLGAQVRKGQKGTPIQFWKFADEQIRTDTAGRPVLDDQGRPVKESIRLERPRVFFATVFNAEQIDGLPAPPVRKQQQWSAIERAERILQASGASIEHGASRAFYRPSTDSIHLPQKERFTAADGYYATALHELGHWSGHESRLNRDLAHPFGSAGYAREELRAEIASMMLGDELGIGHDPGQHAAYVAAWIQALQHDPLEIFRAAADAEKIQDYVLGLEQTQTQRQTEAQAFDAAISPEVPMEQSQPVLTTYQVELARLLELSTSTPGSYAPSDAVRSAYHAAVFVGDAAAILCGPSDDAASVAMAGALAVSQHVKTLYQAAGRDGAIGAGVVAGSIIAWRAEEAAVTAKPSGQVESGGGIGPLVAIVLDDPAKRIATSLCITTETARIFDPAAPELDDGRTLPNLARQEFESERRSLERIGSAGFTAQERVSAVQEEAPVPLHDQERRTPRDIEQRVRRDPRSTDLEISAAKESRNQIEIDELQTSRVYLVVPFKQKEEAKALGAKWDRQQQCWYVPPGIEAAGFDQWLRRAPVAAADALPPSQQVPVPAPSPQLDKRREYLAVPYGERAAAKAAGAEWDKAAKSWYAGAKADWARLARWRLSDATNEQVPAMTPREEFAEALRSLGCVVSGEHPIMDGAKHRISVEGEKHSERSGSGFYVAHLDGHPAGYIKNNRSGIEIKWKAKGYVLSNEQRAALNADAAAKLQARAAEQQRLHEQAAQRVGAQLEDLQPIVQPTPYLQAKGIGLHAGAFTDAEGRKTYIPAIDASNRLWTMQYIQEDGTKRFAKNSRKEGCFHAVGGFNALTAAPVVVIAEGYATAATLSEALGFATVAAFDSGNVTAVARSLRTRFPDKPFIIAGDDDAHLVPLLGVNPGKAKMEEAAKAVGGVKLLPIFAPGEREGSPREFTDFNDLATRSLLGREAVARQARAVLEVALQRRRPDAVEPERKLNRDQAETKMRVATEALEPRRRRSIARH